MILILRIIFFYVSYLQSLCCFFFAFLCIVLKYSLQSMFFLFSFFFFHFSCFRFFNVLVCFEMRRNDFRDFCLITGQNKHTTFFKSGSRWQVDAVGMKLQTLFWLYLYYYCINCTYSTIQSLMSGTLAIVRTSQKNVVR